VCVCGGGGGGGDEVEECETGEGSRGRHIRSAFHSFLFFLSGGQSVEIRGRVG
jgi:hypothetical protein